MSVARTGTACPLPPGRRRGDTRARAPGACRSRSEAPESPLAPNSTKAESAESDCQRLTANLLTVYLTVTRTALSAIRIHRAVVCIDSHRSCLKTPTRATVEGPKERETQVRGVWSLLHESEWLKADCSCERVLDKEKSRRTLLHRAQPNSETALYLYARELRCVHVAPHDTAWRHVAACHCLNYTTARRGMANLEKLVVR